MKESLPVHNLVRLLWFCLLISFVKIASTQSVHESWQETGLPYIQNFSPTDYDAEIQNFCAVQDSSGLMYFGNNLGVLVYDGVSWRLIQIPNGREVRSLSVIEDRLMVGSFAQMGYIDLSTGQYVSLIDNLPEESRGFGSIYQILSINEALYFVASHHLFRWQDGHMQVWEFSDRLFSAFVWKDTLFLAKSNVGIMRLNHDVFEPISNSQLFASTGLFSSFPYDAKSIVLVTYRNGLYLYDGVNFERFRTDADSL